MIYAIVAVLVLIADQWTKYWVTANITLETGSQPIIDGVIKLVNIHNSGAAFGLLDSVPFARWILLGLAVALCVVVIILIVKRTFPGKFPTWCMVLFMAGALGNCIDRSLYGYVVDMFKLEFVTFAVFNVADIFLTVSCLLFIIYLFVGGKDEEEQAAAIAAEQAAKKAEKKHNKKAPEETELLESGDNTEVWDSFKAALHSDGKAPEAEEVPAEIPEKEEDVKFVPEKKAAPAAPVKSAPAAHTDLGELIPELEGINLDDIPAGDGAAADFSVDDILREFGL